MQLTEPCVTEKYFTNRKFEYVDGVYKRTEQKPFVNMQTRQTEIFERVVSFKVYDVDPELGTNIEYYIDNRLRLSGYWTDKDDFEKTFKI